MRILFENGPDQPEALRFTPDRVRAAFAGREALLDDLDLVFSDTEETWQAQSPTADIIVLGRHVALPQAARDGPLRWIQTMSAGVEDIAATLPDRVALTNASGIHAAKGGEFVLAAALMLNFRIPKFAHDKPRKLWRPEFGPVLATRRVTLLEPAASAQREPRICAGSASPSPGSTAPARPVRTSIALLRSTGWTPSCRRPTSSWPAPR